MGSQRIVYMLQSQVLPCDTRDIKCWSSSSVYRLQRTTRRTGCSSAVFVRPRPTIASSVHCSVHNNTTTTTTTLPSSLHHPISAMAASLRPTLMRQALAAPAQRTLTSAVMPAFRVQRSQPILKSIPRATFQTSAARHILPPLPQVIKGGMNDAAPTPAPHPAHGSYHWSFERCDTGICKSSGRGGTV
jgi:hypothetical protein